MAEMNNNSELDQLITKIKNEVTSRSINKVDEVLVMRSMLNDKNFTLGVYDKNQGYMGQRCPHNEAVSFVKNIISGATGLERKDAEVLAEHYEFTKRDSNFLLNNMRDFLNVYTSTGRKINIMQNANTEACLYTKPVDSIKKQVPDKDNPGKSKEVTTAPYVKLVSSTHCPKYNIDK